MTLRLRIALILAAVTLSVAAAAAIVAYVVTRNGLHSARDDVLRSRVEAVELLPEASNRPDGDGPGRPPESGSGDVPDVCPGSGAMMPADAVQVVPVDGGVVVCLAGGPTLPTAEDERGLSTGSTVMRTVTVDDHRYRMISAPWGGGATIQLALDLTDVEQLLGRLRVQLAALVAVAAVLAAGVGWLVARRLARPIVHLRDETRRIATTLDLTDPIDVRAPGEVGDLATSFATMVDAVARSQEQQRRLVADASHEMRTPLTSLRSNVEVLDQLDRLAPGERDAIVADVLQDVDDLATMLTELVDLASDLSRSEEEEPTRLADLARTVADRVERRIGRYVEIMDVHDVLVDARPRQIERAISNLVDNAIKYSEPGTPIEVRIDGTALIVADRGRGLAPGDAERIFERFYRAIDARGHPGSGLGLAIVAEIVRSHGGEVVAANRPGGGAEIGFTLPRSRIR